MKTLKLLTATVAFVLLLFVSTSYSQTGNSIIIGKQEWMTENLNVSIFRNGDPIAHAVSAEDWSNAGKDGKPAWCYYENDIANGTTYGKLYNWYAVNDPRRLAPAGWHVPTDDDWQILTHHLGAYAGGKLKETGLSHWESPNTGATNESGFSALPGGYRNIGGNCNYMGNGAYFWSSSEGTGGDAGYRRLDYNTSVVSRNYGGKPYGFSVRCVRDLTIWGMGRSSIEFFHPVRLSFAMDA